MGNAGWVKRSSLLCVHVVSDGVLDNLSKFGSPDMFGPEQI